MYPRSVLSPRYLQRHVPRFGTVHPANRQKRDPTAGRCSRRRPCFRYFPPVSDRFPEACRNGKKPCLPRISKPQAFPLRPPPTEVQGIRQKPPFPTDLRGNASIPDAGRRRLRKPAGPPTVCLKADERPLDSGSRKKLRQPKSVHPPRAIPPLPNSARPRKFCLSVLPDSARPRRFLLPVLPNSACPDRFPLSVLPDSARPRKFPLSVLPESCRPEKASFPRRFLLRTSGNPAIQSALMRCSHTPACQEYGLPLLPAPAFSVRYNRKRYRCRNFGSPHPLVPSPLRFPQMPDFPYPPHLPKGLHSSERHIGKKPALRRKQGFRERKPFPEIGIGKRPAPRFVPDSRQDRFPLTPDIV